ncbi:16S rRNA (guanine(527)-N(7))-methyltransferase RsmG [Nocardioides anomalus]|uniref:Ribosomal RNA small subunit methyltransferase G n=1 Tax=Nocardioides anomalus TaxID=2712223 RepID=A0A6G6WJ45_9ACTN|nr:16S rRNA (guanine(527)-N(7))-methyltransferase RsmG [Nocardioides anomalus]QIG45226.1 16S rRNA (guanine(527)-N(7))-methyltransferase RsmG [Nocardioides anomalus]
MSGQQIPSGTPPTPEAARGAFPSERLALAERYVELLATAGVERGLIGPREAPRLWERHVFNCLALASVVPESATLADLGSGAGLPGLALAVARPDLRVTLVEPLLRRTTFLEEVVGELGLDGVEVVRARAEELHGSRLFDVVTARALAPLERLLGWAWPLVAPEGALLAMKGSSAAEEIASARTRLRTLRCPEPEVLELSTPDDASTATVVRVARGIRARLG